MEIRIVTFLFFVSVSVVFNTVIIFFAYKAFAGLTSKMTSTMSELRANSETRQVIESLRTAAAQANRAEFLSLWAGQGVRMARREKAGDLVARLAAEAEAALRRAPVTS